MRHCLSHRLIAATLSLVALPALLMVSHPAHAEWEFVASSDFYARFIDPETATRDGDIVSVWEVDDKAEPDRYGVRSLRANTHYDCAARAYRIAHLSGHSKALTGGEVIFSRPGRERWKPVAPGTLGAATLDRLCEE